jgi:hypothetical protein
MWVIAAPLAALWFAVIAIVQVARSPASNALDHTTRDEDEMNDADIEQVRVEIGNNDDVEEGAPIVSDILEWISEAAQRLDIVGTPEVMSVESGGSKSVFLSFKSKSTEMNLWLSGPSWMGPFPRMTVAASKSGSGITIERTAVALEKAIMELQKCVR